MAEKKAVRVDRSLVAVPRERRRRRRSGRGRTMERVGKGVLYVAGAGAVVALLANLDDLKNSKEVRDHWWLLPLGIIAIGYLLRKRGNPYATAVLAVGGALFAAAYTAQSKQAQAQPAPQLPQVPKAPQPKPKSGGDTKGPFFGPGASPFAFLPPGIPGWLQMPNGELARVPFMSPPNGRPFTS